MKSIRKILLVDDEPGVLEALAEIIGGDGIEVIRTASLSQAEFVIQSATLDAVITDLRLTPEGEEGLELLTRVRSGYPGTPVIVISGQGTVELKEKAMRLGAAFFIEKPIRIDVLNGRLAELGLHGPCPAAGEPG